MLGFLLKTLRSEQIQNDRQQHHGGHRIDHSNKELLGVVLYRQNLMHQRPKPTDLLPHHHHKSPEQQSEDPPVKNHGY